MEHGPSIRVYASGRQFVVVPLVDRGRLSAASNTLGGVVLTTWDTELWNAQDWFRIK